MPPADVSQPSALGFASLTQGLAENFQQCEKLMLAFSESKPDLDLNPDPLNLSTAFFELSAKLLQDPEKWLETSAVFWQDSFALYEQTWGRLLGGNGEDVIQPAKGDNRFRHQAWVENQVFDFIKQSYLLSAKYMRSVVKDVDGLDEKTAEKVEFFTQQFIDAWSPTNFVATNPAVIEKTLETKGANLVHGLKTMLDDLERGHGRLKTRMTDEDAFELGINVAMTPGKVVFQNRMMQLIQYAPSTEQVHKRPLLVVPPWINKFYILDLQAKNSFLKWAVDQGHTVFTISWVNPDESYADTTFDDYLTDGPMAALDAIKEATGEADVNAIGYCLGGTLLAVMLAHMTAKNDSRIKSATFFTTMLDFAKPGDLGVFINEERIEDLEKQMNEKGYLDGGEMAGTFNMLRANDLIWSFYINNYLLGNDPRPFDLLYWNSDSTRMPATMHGWYIRNLYIKNLLIQPGALTLSGTPIDLSTVTTPACFVSTRDDHIAPWKSTYAGARLFSGPVRFILGGSGHIAGIINPPAANKYGYRVTAKPPADPQAWADKAKVTEGSWWTNWDKWVGRYAGKADTPARVPGQGGLAAIEEAPGSYVKIRAS